MQCGNEQQALRISPLKIPTRIFQTAENEDGLKLFRPTKSKTKKLQECFRPPKTKKLQECFNPPKTTDHCNVSPTLWIT
jgi:hypothetical protein